jgi:hypothetical protein
VIEGELYATMLVHVDKRNEAAGQWRVQPRPVAQSAVLMQRWRFRPLRKSSLYQTVFNCLQHCAAFTA